MSISPFHTPEAFDFITIDGVKSPLVNAKLIRTAINGRELDYDEQKSPLFSGIFTVIRGQKIVSVDYSLEYWDDSAIPDVEAWQRILRKHQKQSASSGGPLGGKKVRPLRVVDPILDGLDVSAMWCPYVGSRFERVEGLQKWRMPFKLREHGPRKPIGGPLRDESNKNTILNAERARDQAQREAQVTLDLARLEASLGRSGGI